MLSHVLMISSQVTSIMKSTRRQRQSFPYTTNSRFMMTTLYQVLNHLRRILGQFGRKLRRTLQIQSQYPRFKKYNNGRSLMMFIPRCVNLLFRLIKILWQTILLSHNVECKFCVWFRNYTDVSTSE